MSRPFAVPVSPVWVLLCLFSVGMLTSGCYHQQVVTGKEEGSNVIENEWANSFVFGIVPPPVVETMEECPDGVARVETKLTFLNGVVSALTMSIYTPMYVKVTCASGTMSSMNAPAIRIDSNAPADEKAVAVRHALEESRTSDRAVLVQFE
ncbi:Bor family protein [Longibacter salinarum]|nr:Bor family protein [Longibacter salinarum]